ncbi:leucine-rich repeat domain-containing protein [Halosquirtibacter xylanolyticus]|uniref:leucine-rich repeat domain-containing protein n=1 Tax=Halosquirtibacter xylanolyticus TaxID=3374599 RepID=UPI0037482B18|nr:leucine-rich repeat domain-containing protein [Prolixibacteraceae bacterium]
MKKCLFSLLVLLCPILGFGQAKLWDTSPYNYEGENGVAITRYLGSDTEVVFPADVEGQKVLAIIGVFEDKPDENVGVFGQYFNIPNRTITRIDLSQSTNLKVITDEALGHCIALKTVVWNDGLEEVGSAAFYKSSLNGIVTLPSSVKRIGMHAFSDCALIKVIEIGDQIETIRNFAFSMHDSPQLIIHSKTFPDIAENAFRKASQPRIFVEDDVVAAYRKNDKYKKLNPVFRRLSTFGKHDGDLWRTKKVQYKLSRYNWIDGVEITSYHGDETVITIPATIDGQKVVGISGKFGAGPLSSGIFGQSSAIPNTTVTAIDFSGAENLYYINQHAFAYCHGLTSIEFPKSLVEIGNYAFKGCLNNAQPLVIPDNVTTIGQSAFAWTPLHNLTIGAKVSTVGNFAFSSSGIGILHLKAPKAPTCEYSSFAFGDTGVKMTFENISYREVYRSNSRWVTYVYLNAYKKVATDVAQADVQHYRLWSSNGQVAVRSTKPMASVAMYDTMGRKLQESTKVGYEWSTNLGLGTTALVLIRFEDGQIARSKIVGKAN